MNDEKRNDDLERLMMLIQRELDGEILPEEEAELQQALQQDDDLQREYTAQRRLTAMLAEDRNGLEVPAGLADRISERVLESESPAPTLSLLSFLKPVAMAASVLLLVGISFWAGRQGTTAAPETGPAGIGITLQELLDEHPELDAAEVKRLYRACIKSIDQVDEEHRNARIRAYSDLESEIRKLVLRVRTTGAERK